MSIKDELDAMGVTVKTKDKSRLMRVIGWFLGLFGLDFMGKFWTTVSGKTIWAHVGADLSNLDRYAGVIRHELVHIRQARRWPVWFQVSYLLFPLPIGLAWCRWYWERKAFMVDIEAGRLTVDQAVDMLWRYGWPWPKSLMRKWFDRQFERLP